MTGWAGQGEVGGVKSAVVHNSHCRNHTTEYNSNQRTLNDGRIQ